jgi:Flp pilus assembly secretin CpaC
MRIFDQFVVLSLACTVTCLAESKALAQSAATPYPPQPYVAAPETLRHPISPKTVYKSIRGQLGKSEHLRLAAEHLEAAGKTELAKQIQQEVLIEAKLEQIRKLQAEVEQLRAGTEKSPQVLTLQMKVIELQTTEMRKLGLDIENAGGSRLLDAGAIDSVVEALRANEMARILAEPTLVTVSGRPASFQSGGEIPILVPQGTDNVSVEYRQTGTRVDCVGTVLKSGRVRLEICSTISEVDADHSIELKEISVPGLRTRKVDTAIEMDAGQTAVLCGLIQKDSGGADDGDDDNTKSLLLAVTVHLGEPTVATAVEEHPLGNHGFHAPRY